MYYDSGSYLIGYCIGAIIAGCIFGAVCERIMKNKGYDGGGFWWGFFLTWIGVVVCALKPENATRNSNPQELNYSGLNENTVKENTVKKLVLLQ